MSAFTPSLSAWAASEKLWAHPDAKRVQASAQQAKMAGMARRFFSVDPVMGNPSLKALSRDSSAPSLCARVGHIATGNAFFQRAHHIEGLLQTGVQDA